MGAIWYHKDPRDLFVILADILVTSILLLVVFVFDLKAVGFVPSVAVL